MFEKIGALLFCFGLVCADSQNIWIPWSMVILGAFMVYASERGEEYAEKLNDRTVQGILV